MRLARGVPVALVVASLVVGVVATPAASADGTGAVALPGDGTAIDADSTSVEIAVRPDGTAEWTVQHRAELDSEEQRERFERVDRRVEANPLNYTGPFIEQMREAAAVASEETGRSMTAGNTTVSARATVTGYAVVTYRFEWTGFAERSNGRLRVGDALVGFFLDSESTTLILAWPAGYELEQVSPEPDETRDRSVRWRGPLEFGPGEPRLVISGGLPVPIEPVAVAAVLLAVLAVGWRVRGGRPSLPGPWGAGEGGDTAGDAGAAGEDAVPEELLSDPERVLNLVEDHGGRMKQQAVVAELEWSETKTSQVVGGLQDEGKLEVYRIGRENVLSLPGEMDV